MLCQKIVINLSDVHQIYKKIYSGVNILPFWLLDSSRMRYLFPHGIHDACQNKNENEHFYLKIVDIDEKSDFFQFFLIWKSIFWKKNTFLFISLLLMGYLFPHFKIWATWFLPYYCADLEQYSPLDASRVAFIFLA